MLLEVSYLLCNTWVTKWDRILHAEDMLPVPFEHLKCEFRDQMNSDSAGHVPCLPVGALGATANNVNHTVLQLLRCNSLEAEAI